MTAEQIEGKESKRGLTPRFYGNDDAQAIQAQERNKDDNYSDHSNRKSNTRPKKRETAIFFVRTGIY